MPMTPEQDELLSYHGYATDAVVAQAAEEFRKDSADLLLRNVYVAADRLGSSGAKMSSLSGAGKDALIDASLAAAEIAPVAKEDMERHAGESDADYKWRTTFELPLLAFNTMVNRGNFDREDPNQMRKIKAGVQLAGQAFKHMVADNSKNPAMLEVLPYLMQNAVAARGGIPRQR